jgi:hypothetical protein
MIVPPPRAARADRDVDQVVALHGQHQGLAIAAVKDGRYLALAAQAAVLGATLRGALLDIEFKRFHSSSHVPPAAPGYAGAGRKDSVVSGPGLGSP